MQRVEKLVEWRAIVDHVKGLAAPVTATNDISLRGAIGRVLAKPFLAAKPVPALTHAVMDGFVLGSRPPGQYRLLAQRPDQLGSGDAFAVSTGQAVPEGSASVVLANRVLLEHQWLTVTEAQAKDNIRRQGEEAAEGAVLVKTNTLLDARHIALAAAAGVDSAAVYVRPRIGLLALHEATALLPHHTVFSALLKTNNLSVSDLGVTRQALLTDQLKRASSRHDLIVVIAESLGGEEGLLARAISDAGGDCTVLRAAIKPAKPIIVGRLGEMTIIGLAGTAYATTVAAHLVLRPLLRRMAHLEQADPFLPAVAGFDRSRQPGRAEALPVRLVREQGQLIAHSAGRFGQLSALAAMDGFALVEAESGDIVPGHSLLYHPLLMPLL